MAVTPFDGIYVCKTCTLDGHPQAGKQEEVCRSQIRRVRRVIKHSYHLLSQELAHTDHIVYRSVIVEMHSFSSLVQLGQPAGYAVIMGSKPPGKMQH